MLRGLPVRVDTLMMFSNQKGPKKEPESDYSLIKKNHDLFHKIFYRWRCSIVPQPTLQMFTGIYGGPAGKLECGDFRIAGFTCISAFSINSVGVPFMDFAGKL